MKIRNGFVSNSSSSSFMLAVKGELNKEKIISVFNVKKKDFWYAFADLCAQYLIDNSAQADPLLDVDSFYKYSDAFSDVIDEKKLVKKGYTIYVGNIADFGEGGTEFSTAFRRACNNFHLKNKKRNILFFTRSY